MRVALVSREYPPDTALGGIGSQTWMKARGLAALGHEVHVISQSTNGRSYQYVDGDVHVLRSAGLDDVLASHTDLVHRLSHSIAVAGTLLKLQSTVALDIVDFPEWGAEGYAYLLNRTKWNSVPAVVHLHGPLVMLAHTIGWPPLDTEDYRVGAAMEGTCLRLADGVFSSSSCSADWCAKFYGLNRSDIPVLHTGIDTKLFSPRDVPKDQHPTIIFVGRLSKGKGAGVLVDAVIALATDVSGLRVRMIGRGETEFIKLLQEKALNSGFPDLLEFPGFATREELPMHLSRAHVFAAPSLYEGGPVFANLEAMACGLPVIASGGSGAAETIVHGHTGLLVAPGDVDGLTVALKTLLTNAPLRDKLSANARHYVETEAESSICLRKITAYYEIVIQNSTERLKAATMEDTAASSS
jgi:glycosyltransferase involved in cell wall biosynthesis